MKRFIIFKVILINVFLCISCSYNKIDDYNEQTKATNNISISEIDDASSNNRGKNEIVKTEINDKGGKLSHELYYQSEKYSIAPSELSKYDMSRPEDNSEWLKSLVIQYPQIYNLKDNQKQLRLNDFLCNKVISYHDILFDRDYIEYTLNYKIMSANNYIISILFYGEIVNTKTINNFAFATTLNIESEEEEELNDYIIIKDSSVEDYLFSSFDVVENTYENIEEHLPFIEKFVLTYDKNVHVNNFYVKDATLGIIIPTHDNRGYILIEGDFE